MLRIASVALFIGLVVATQQAHAGKRKVVYSGFGYAAPVGATKYKVKPNKTKVAYRAPAPRVAAPVYYRASPVVRYRAPYYPARSAVSVRGYGRPSVYVRTPGVRVYVGR